MYLLLYLSMCLSNNVTVASSTNVNIYVSSIPNNVTMNVHKLFKYPWTNDL